MKRRVARSVVAISIVLALVIPPPATWACGPFFTEAIFIQTKHPDLPFERYAAGELGIVRPSYARSYLVVAYRYWQGKGLTATEQKQAVELWNHRLTNEWDSLEADGKRKSKDAAQLWLEARKEAGAEETAESKKLREGANPNAPFEDGMDRYLAFVNCTDNALTTATGTLKARVKEFGATSEAVKAWIEAQDIVFSNCKADREGRATGVRLPGEAAASLPAKIRTDREYQRAASYFYGMKWDEAEKSFLKIAENKESSWRQTAAVVAVRCRIREATLGKGSKREDLQAAGERLRALEAQPAMEEMRPAIRKLRGFVEFRTNPAGRRLELAQALASGSSPATLREDLDDYTKLLDGALGEDPESDPPPPAEAAKRRATLSKPQQPDDLTDWLLNFQAADEKSAAHAFARWKATKSAAWLAAAISKEQPNAMQQELLAAAAELGEKSAAYDTAGFYRAKLLAVGGKRDEAREILDKLLARNPEELPVSSRNLALALRMKLARNFEEFLRFAPRQTAALTLDINGYDLPEPPDSCQYGSPAEIAACREKFKPVVRFDSDAARVFTEKLPMEYWLKGAESANLPQQQRKEIAEGGWARAVLLDDEGHGKRAAGLLGKLAPELGDALQKYEEAATPEERRFAAMLLLLKRPEMVPEVRAGGRRETDAGRIDSYGNNWWCKQSGGVIASADETFARYYSFYNKWTPPLAEINGKLDGKPDFLTDEEWSAAQGEIKKLAAAEPGPNWLSAQAIAFAKAHPDDPRAPEALHLAVRATRHGCGDDATGKYSKQAFKFLHQKYPKSEWTKKTPYWFN